MEDETYRWLVPISAFLLLVLLIGGLWVVVRFVKPKRKIGYDNFEDPPRPPPRSARGAPVVQELAPASAPVVGPQEVAKKVEAVIVANDPVGPDELEEVAAPSVHQFPEKQDDAKDGKCCACEQPADPGVIELEDWRQVNTVIGALMALFKVKARVTPGRRLYSHRKWCRSCAAIADFLNARFERDEEAKAAASRRVWERKGLVDAVKDHIAEADGRYDEDKRNRTRRPWRGDA